MIPVLPEMYCVLRYSYKMLVEGHGQSPERVLYTDRMLWVGIASSNFGKGNARLQPWGEIPRPFTATDIVVGAKCSYTVGMKLTIQMQLLPTAEQAVLLRSTMERFNEAATFAARIGFDAGVFSQISIHKLCYLSIRERFKISAQMAVRAIGKAVECFKRDKTICPVFKPLGAMTYDERFLSFKGLDKVSILTLSGRELIALVYGQYQSERFDRIKGQCDLVYRDGKWFLYSTIDLPELPPDGVTDFLGVDLGIAKIATDSDGGQHSGKAVERIRKKHNLQRKRLQKKGTK